MKFEVGDRVTYVGKSFSQYSGASGTVTRTYISFAGYDCAEVQFDIAANLRYGDKLAFIQDELMLENCDLGEVSDFDFAQIMEV